jgi:hypothetical protein
MKNRVSCANKATAPWWHVKVTTVYGSSNCSSEAGGRRVSLLSARCAPILLYNKQSTFRSDSNVGVEVLRSRRAYNISHPHTKTPEPEPIPVVGRNNGPVLDVGPWATFSHFPAPRSRSRSADGVPGCRWAGCGVAATVVPVPVPVPAPAPAPPSCCGALNPTSG